MRSVFAFVAFVCSIGLLVLLILLIFFVDAVSKYGSVAGSGVGSRVGVLSKFFIGKNLYLRLLKTFSLALNNNRKLF